jgi:hypothetical protein
VVRHKLRAESPSYTASTISFDAGTKTITDTASGLAAFETGDIIIVSGSDNNDGRYTVATGGTASSIITAEALTGEDAGASITISTANDVEDDQLIESAISAASRWIDSWCGRRFYTTDTDETKYYARYTPIEVMTDDLVSVTTLAIDDDADWTWGTTIAGTNYALYPWNTTPKTSIILHPDADEWFPLGDRAIKIVGKFGYSAVPDDVAEACALLAEQIYKRKDSIFGVEGASGFIQRQFGSFENDTQIKALLAGHRRLV